MLERVELVSGEMFCRAVLLDVELLGPLEALSVRRTLLASQLFPSEIS